MIQKYGVDNAAKSSEIRHKSIKTSTKNGKRSSLELYLEQVFIKNNISFISEYSNDLYPYHCDFYLPDIDYFIEIQGYWSHGGHPYDPNNLIDNETLSKWIKKSRMGHKQYTGAIHV